MSAYCIRPIEPDDAAAMLAFCRAVGAESDNLSFGAEGLPLTVEQERAALASFAANPREINLAAADGGETIGSCRVAPPKRRFAHRAELSISVRRPRWRQGIGRALMQRAIEQARAAGMEIISLEVRADNLCAIALYRSFGFEEIGFFRRFGKIGGAYYDALLMNLYL